MNDFNEPTCAILYEKPRGLNFALHGTVWIAMHYKAKPRRFLGV
jgi:hypothetical protein